MQASLVEKVLRVVHYTDMRSHISESNVQVYNGCHSKDIKQTKQDLLTTLTISAYFEIWCVYLESYGTRSVQIC